MSFQVDMARMYKSVLNLAIPYELEHSTEQIKMFNSIQGFMAVKTNKIIMHISTSSTMFVP